MSEKLKHLIVHAIEETSRRYTQHGKKGLLDPEYEKTRFVNPRYQEVCLTLALAAQDNSALKGLWDSNELIYMAIGAIETWIHNQQRNGSVKCQPNGSFDSQATAYGLFAVTRTLMLLSDHISPSLKNRTKRSIRRAARFLINAPMPDGPETRPLRYAALMSAAKWLEHPGISNAAQGLLTDSYSMMYRELSDSNRQIVDAGAYSLALFFLTIATPDPVEKDIEMWKMISERCLYSTTPTGIMGGGAETSLACLPIIGGFALASKHVEEAAEMTTLLDSCYETEWYNSLIDPDVPWLIPMSYMALYALEAINVEPEISNTQKDYIAEQLFECGAGRFLIGDWLIRTGTGGTIGWLHHIPSNSTRLFGSPSGLALREGPWIAEKNRIRQPTLAGDFRLRSSNPFVIKGDIYSLPIPSGDRMLRRIGFPRWRGKQAKIGTRLAPPFKTGNIRTLNPIEFAREIELKDGALTIETFIEGRVLHRLPMIWPGGMFGNILINKEVVPLDRPYSERSIREIVFEGAPWPAWTVRFDKPVDILYEPIYGPINVSPMRFLTAAAGSFDIVAEDRLHMAWRVLE